MIPQLENASLDGQWPGRVSEIGMADGRNAQLRGPGEACALD